MTSSSSAPELSISMEPIVIDNGSGLIKAGFAGVEQPKIIIPSYVGRPKHTKVIVGGADPDYFCGEKAREWRGILKLNYPMRHGIVTDWKDQQLVWQHVYNELNVVPDQHPVLLTESPLNPRSNRLKAAEYFFETFNAPAFYVQIQSILSLYSSGRTTGVVLDSGDGVTTAVPVFEGFVMQHAVSRIDVAGRDITEYLQLLLRKAGHIFHTSSEIEIVKTIKEKSCFVAYNIEKSEKEEAEETETSYTLPDGSTVSLGAEKYKAPEVLFNPSLIGLEYVGIHQCLANSIFKCDLDIRRQLFNDIWLSGGSTLFDGLGERLLYEIRKLTPQETKIKIYAPPERMLSCWVGGSILASLSTFKKMWITKKEYEDSGKQILFKKSF
eukprot:TRINITY_DN2056_c0_g1_i1.p1 TRINITY_DN2056_c0_g1~~TRINITY_DN2056_c0_g1_i1.p1  ORF type:complete len:382 (+),score=63.79 TRINITY_DN2056_c0_g1_i1:61-1206(+)